MRELPILFSGAMVRALLDRSKTQTRRVMSERHRYHFIEACGDLELCPYGMPGDRLYVRETFRPVYPQDPTYNGGEPIEYDYQATYTPGDRLVDPVRWTPSIHMPRAASRILLEVTGVRVERLQEISSDDAFAEGCPGDATWAIDWYRDLWDSLNASRGYGWNANPWVWIIEFAWIKST